jgi:leucyl/phenylalanyl-tRNA--protein transferase
MPIDPPPSDWVFPDVSDVADDLVGVGADLEPATLLDAYRKGCFPMPGGGSDHAIEWWSPQRRGVLPLEALRVTRSLRKSAKRMEIRVDTAFEAVMAGCADPQRDGGWINTDFKQAYLELHRLGWAHSVETWLDGELVGGLYGVSVGGLFAGESMFRRVRDASKVALMGLVELMSDEYAEQRVLDVQWRTDHLETLGVVEVSRPLYLLMLRNALDVPLPAVFSQRPLETTRQRGIAARRVPLGRII